MAAPAAARSSLAWYSWIFMGGSLVCDVCCGYTTHVGACQSTTCGLPTRTTRKVWLIGRLVVLLTTLLRTQDLRKSSNPVGRSECGRPSARNHDGFLWGQADPKRGDVN